MRSSGWVAAHEAAQRKWPGVRLEVARFGRHLESLGWTGQVPGAADELYLTCACAEGDEAACRFFNELYISQVRDAAMRICRDAALRDEALQRVRHKLLVGPPPGILKYNGRGSLLGWVRSVTRRAALDLKREQAQRPVSPVGEMSPALESSIESRLDRRRFLADFEGSLARAFAALPTRDRNLLRMHYAGSVGIDAIGRAYGIHRATAARWLVRIRTDILDAVRRDMTGAGSDLSNAEFDQVVRLVKGQLSLVLGSWDAASRASALGLYNDEALGAHGAGVRADD